MKAFIGSAAMIVFTFTALHAIAQSDESGTLVMVARTTSGIVVAVDSAISTRDPITRRPIVINAPMRKLLDFGQQGACTIDAFTGDAERGNILAEKARDWLKKNSTARGFDAINGILAVAAASWNSEHYLPDSLGFYPGNRRVGSIISHVVCGDLVGTDFMILEGLTTLASDGRATQGRAFGIGDSFEFGGFFDYPMLLGLPENAGAPPTSEAELRRIYPFIRAEMLSDPSVLKALEAFKHEQERTTKIRVNTKGAPVMPKPTLGQAQVQTLFAASYKAVERYTFAVASPNNVRLLTKCGRFDTTVEGRWPICRR